MKNKFLEMCEKADMIQLKDGIVLEYYPSSLSLAYRVLGEYNYISLEDLENENISHDNGWWIINRNRILYRLKFYQELTEH